MSANGIGPAFRNNERVDQIVEKQGAFPLRPIEVPCWAIVLCASSFLQGQK